MTFYKVKPFKRFDTATQIILYSHLHPETEEFFSQEKQKINSHITKTYEAHMAHKSSSLLHLVRLYWGSELGPSIHCRSTELLLNSKQLYQ